MDRGNTDETAVTVVARAVDGMVCQFEQKQSALLLRAVLRGERPVSDLAGTGISLSDPMSSVGKLAGQPVWSSDLAEGILNLKGNAVALCEWATFVVRTADLFDCASHDMPCCERLMTYIWQIAYGQGLSPRALTLATMVRNWPRKRAV